MACLRQVQAEDRSATTEEQAVMARWSGWGAVPGVFDADDARFEEIRRALGELLGPQDLAAASRNTLNAHYTDAGLVKAIWGGLGALGFAGGNVLEPGCGVGTFIGLAPDNAQMVGVELDPTTAAIAQALYPDAQILAESFAQTRAPEASFDATVGNVPFGKLALHDPVHNPSGQTIHNHFVLKALHLTRPGGLVTVLTSRYALDARNPAARREMAELGDLVGAVRLPEGAHRRATGTDVVTDLLVLRRRQPGEPARGESFERTVPLEVEGGTVVINEYFATRPQRVLGEVYCGRGVYGSDELLVRGEVSAAAGLSRALGDIAEYAAVKGLSMAPSETGVATPVALVPRAEARPEGYIAVVGQGFTEVVHGRPVAYEPPKTQVVELRALIALRDTMVGLLEAEAASRDDTPELAELRGSLNRRYDTYVATYGPLNRFSWRRAGGDKHTGKQKYARNRPPRGGFRSDPFASVVEALEIYDPEDARAIKAPLFSHRMVAPPAARLGAERPEDALAICLDQHGDVRLGEVARLLGLAESETRLALGTLVFDDPEAARLVPAAEYCSGNVRAKLAVARVAAGENHAYQANVAALEAVLPTDLGPGEIDARLGAVWIDAHYVQAFLRELLEDPQVRVEHPGGSDWMVRGGRYGVLAWSTWGTERRSAGELVGSMLRQSPIQVRDKIEGGGTVINLTETLAAKEKAGEVAERFSTWCWEDPERAVDLARIYNERFNSLVLRSYDGAHMALPGMAVSFEPMPHQLAAVARIVAEPAVLLAHEVGAGKTAAMAAGAVELRRLGLVSKPAFAVPNHMVDQFSREFLQLYPQARLLVGTKEELDSAERRRRFVGRAATGDWDAIIMSHSTFEQIPLSPDNREAYLSREAERIRRWLERSKAAGGLSVKRLEAKLVSAEEGTKKKLDSKKDAGVTFELTGIDYLLIDEAHLHKNLRTVSNIPGADIEGSKRAQDLDMKLDWLRQRNPNGRCVTFATATPVANSITEAYVMQRYLRPDLLEQAGIEDFDSWAATFGEVVAGIELAPDTTTFRMQSRFAKFTNVPELLRMFHVAADIKTAEDLALPTPALVGGSAQTVVVPRSAELAEVGVALGERAEAVRGGRVRPEEDNMLKISGYGRAAALDLRLVGLERPEGATKIEVAAERIADIWQAHRHDRFLDPAGDSHPRPGALQLVFCDMGTPGDRWNVYEELRTQLVARGLPQEAIRFIHEPSNDRQKADLFAACRAGSVAVLVGSTPKMGVGTNVQARAVALHHLDCPWRPADLAQRDGRILRQGNQSSEVEVLRYVTERSFDTYNWQTVERKARFIGQLMRGSLDVREIEDIGDTALSYAQVKALAAGDPRLIEQAEVGSEVARLERLSRAWGRAQASLLSDRERLETRRAELGSEMGRAEVAAGSLVNTHGDRFVMVVSGRTYTRRTDAGTALIGRLQDELKRAGHYEDRTVGDLGSLGGFSLTARVWSDAAGPGASLRFDGVPRSDTGLRSEDLAPAKAGGLVSRLEHRLERLNTLPGDILAEMGKVDRELARAREGRQEHFPQRATLEAARSRAGQLKEELAQLVEPEPTGPDQEDPESPGWIYAEYQRVAGEELTARVKMAITPGLDEAAVERLLPVVRRAEAVGVDATGVLCRAGLGGLGEAELVKELGRQTHGGSPLAPYAGVLPPPPAGADPAATEQLVQLGGALEAWRDGLTNRLVAGEQLPQWADRLGPAPEDPTVRAGWAAQVAQVALWREVNRLPPGDLFGPEMDLNQPEGQARARTVAAGRAAKRSAAAQRTPSSSEPVQGVPSPVPHQSAAEIKQRADYFRGLGWRR